MDKIDSKLQRRQLELMKKRFDVDEENKVVKLDLYYDKADDVLLSNIDTYVPTFDREKFSKIREIILDFPLEYKADLNIKIDDYQNYKPEEVLDGFNDAVELTHYSGNREHKKKWIQIVFLLIAGILLLNIMAQGVIENWLNLSETQTSVFKEVFDITSWVFIWQAVSLCFLSPSLDRITSLTLAHRLRDVTFLDKNGKVLVSEDYRDSYAQTAREQKLRIVGKYSLLMAGAAYFGLGLSSLVSIIFDIPSIVTMIQSGGDNALAIALMSIIINGLMLLIVVIEILGGLAAISAFTGKIGKLYKMIIPFGITTFLLQTFALIYGIIAGLLEASVIIGLVISSVYLMGGIFLIITREKVAKE